MAKYAKYHHIYLPLEMWKLIKERAKRIGVKPSRLVMSIIIKELLKNKGGG